MRLLVCVVATLVLATPAHAAFTHAAGNAPNGARAAAVFRPKLKTPPTITGTAREGETLTASDGEWARQPESWTRTWLRCGADACREVGQGATYRLTAADVSSRMRVRVTATNAGGSTAALSTETMAVDLRVRTPPQEVNAPVVTGEASVDVVLAADRGSWLGQDNRYAVQWLRCASATTCAEIPGETGWTYRTDASDAGLFLRARVTATNDDGTRTTASDPTPAIARRTMTYMACANPDTKRGVWSGSGPPPGFDVTHQAPFSYADSIRCGVGVTAPEIATHITGGETTTAWTQTRWRYTVPSQMTLVGGDVFRAASYSGPMGISFTVGPDGPAYPGAWAECSQNHGCVTGQGSGSPAALFDEPNRQWVPPHTPSGFGFTLHCHTNGGLCNGRGWHAIFGARLKLRDESSPTLAQPATGSLLAATVPSTASLALDAQDVGSGLYRARVLVDDHQVATRAFIGVLCNDVNPANDVDYEFASHTPCPTSASPRWTFDTTGWPKGEHRVHVLLEDAAHNTITVGKRLASIG